MYGGKLRKIRFRYVGPSIEAVLDRLPTAQIIAQDNEGWTVEAEVFGKGIEMWLLSQGSKVEVLSSQAIPDKKLAEAESIIARTEPKH